MKVNKWVAAGVGAVMGLAIGIAVSLATDLPLAPEVGLLAGGCAGYLLGGLFKSRP
jgi:hypothetical protein